MVSKLRRRFRGSRGKSVLKEFWRVPSRLMGERSGFVNSAQNQMCGRGGIVGAATMTSPGRRSPQELEKAHRLFDVKRGGRWNVQKFGGRK